MIEKIKFATVIFCVVTVISGCSYIKNTTTNDGTIVANTVLTLKQDFIVDHDDGLFGFRNGKTTFKKGSYFPTDVIAHHLGGSKEVTYIGEQDAQYVKSGKTKIEEYTAYITINIRDLDEPAQVGIAVRGGPLWLSGKIPREYLELKKEN